MKLFETLDILRPSLSPDEAFEAFIRLAANICLGREPEDFKAPTKPRVDQDALDILATAARQLLAEPAAVRFASVMAGIDTLVLNTGKRGTGIWIRKASCKQLLNLIGDSASVRFSFGMSLRPCLTYLSEMGERSHPTKAEFWSQNLDECSIAKDLSVIFGFAEKLKIVEAMPWQVSQAEPADCEVIMPPFGMDVSKTSALPQRLMAALDLDEKRSVRLNCETVAITNALESDAARLIISTSDGELFRMVGTEKTARRNLVDSGRLAAVLAVPSGMMFTNTGIKTNLLILSPDSDNANTTRFIDLGHEEVTESGQRGRLEVAKDAEWGGLLDAEEASDRTFIRDVDREEIIENNTVLVPERYLNSGARERIDALLARSDVATLEDIVELIRPVTISEDIEGEYTLLEAAPGDLNARGFIGKPRREINANRPKYNKAFNQQLRPGDVLMSIKGSVGITALVPDDVPKEGATVIWTSGQSMMILRPKKRLQISSLALFEYLSNATVQEHLQSLAGGSAIQTLAMKDIKSLPIPVPDAGALTEIERSFAERQTFYDKIEDLEEAVTRSRHNSWPHSDLGESN